MPKTWSFHSAGVLIRDGKILLGRKTGGEEYALPGGNIELGESTRESLVREYSRKTGASVSCGRFLWIEESVECEEESSLNFYYMVELSDDASERSFAQDTDTFYDWLPIEKIGSVKTYPEFLGNEITKLEKYPKHFKSNYC